MVPESMLDIFLGDPPLLHAVPRMTYGPDLHCASCASNFNVLAGPLSKMTSTV